MICMKAILKNIILMLNDTEMRKNDETDFYPAW